jgi:SAM-dependent methyltransferase
MLRHQPRKHLTLTFALAIVPVLSTIAFGADPLRAIAEDIFARSDIHGGLIVHLGCRDGKLTTALRVNDSFLVQGLDTDPGNIERARAHIQSCGQSEKISVSLFDGQHLPYASNLVNVLVISTKSSVAKVELLRVLSPGGVAVMLDAAASFQSSFRKPWPDEIDEWTHYLHGPDNNAVANDSVVGPPRHFQWISGPRLSRSHDHLTSVTAASNSKARRGRGNSQWLPHAVTCTCRRKTVKSFAWALLSESGNGEQTSRQSPANRHSARRGRTPFRQRNQPPGLLIKRRDY